jgi:hypothetical protein
MVDGSDSLLALTQLSSREKAQDSQREGVGAAGYRWNQAAVFFFEFYVPFRG